jgi:hypothetical protein
MSHHPFRPGEHEHPQTSSWSIRFVFKSIGSDCLAMSAKISSMKITSLPVGPRKVTRWRRVTLPTNLAIPSGMVHGAWVRVEQARRDRGALIVRQTEAPTSMDRSAYLGRTVTKSGQISLPAALMDRVGLDVGDWVYFMATPNAAAIRVLPAGRVGLMGERLKR